MLWLNFLHFYQPANTDKNKILEATEASYERIIRGLEENPNIKFTINISGCLLLRLDDELKRIDLIRRIKRLVLKKQIELVGTAAYHPLLPLIDRRQAKEQIKENENIVKKYFGEKIKLRGFFFPEMAYSISIAKLLKEMGYEWIILDEISANGKLNNIDTSLTYNDTNSGLNVIFRDRLLSQTYIPESIINGKINKELIITGTDAELYGLRHVDEPANFENVLNQANTLGIQTDLISNFIDQSKEKIALNLIESNWESTEKELKEKKPYQLWINSENKIQLRLWDLALFAQELHYKYQSDPNIWWSRWHLVRGLASCTFWWASDRDLRKVFGPIAWNPDQIELGIQELVRSIRDLEKSTNLNEKLEAENKFNEILEIIWKKHWKNY